MMGIPSEAIRQKVNIAPGDFQAPFRPDAPVADFQTNASLANGTINGEQLIRVGSDQSLSNGSGWMTTLDQISDANGTLLSGSEIQQRLGLNAVPTAYAPAVSIQSGGTMYMGIANDLSSYGWGSGGGIQYYLNGPYAVGNALPLEGP